MYSSRHNPNSNQHTTANNAPKKPTNRGPRHAREGYEDRLSQRKMQSSPANRSVPAHRGPSQRPSGMSQKDWQTLMGRR